MLLERSQGDNVSAWVTCGCFGRIIGLLCRELAFLWSLQGHYGNIDVKGLVVCIYVHLKAVPDECNVLMG